MTHHIVAAAQRRAETIARELCDTEFYDAARTYLVEQLAQHVAEVLRLAREPGVSVDRALTKSLGKMPAEGWRAGIDALLREIEEG